MLKNKLKYQNCSLCWNEKPIEHYMSKDGRIIYDKCYDCRCRYKREKQKEYRDRKKAAANIQPSSINLDSSKPNKQLIKRVARHIVEQLDTPCCLCGYEKNLNALSIYDTGDSHIRDAIQMYITEPTDANWADVLIWIESASVICNRCYIEYTDGMVEIHPYMNEKSNLDMPMPRM